LLLRTLETVPIVTPALFATSLMVAISNYTPTLDTVFRLLNNYSILAGIVIVVPSGLP
jgi:hypothetical protein